MRGRTVASSAGPHGFRPQFPRWEMEIMTGTCRCRAETVVGEEPLRHSGQRVSVSVHTEGLGWGP